MANVNKTPRMTEFHYGYQDSLMQALNAVMDNANWIAHDCTKTIEEMKESMFPVCQNITYTNALGKTTTADLYVLKTWNQGNAHFGLAVITEDGDVAFKPQVPNTLVMSLVGVYMDHMELDYLRSVGERRMRIANAKNFIANCKSWNPYSKTVA